MTKTNIIEQIKSEHNLSYSDLATRIGYHKTYLIQVNSGTYPLSPKLLKVLHLTFPDYFDKQKQGA